MSYVMYGVAAARQVLLQNKYTSQMDSSGCLHVFRVISGPLCFGRLQGLMLFGPVSLQAKMDPMIKDRLLRALARLGQVDLSGHHLEHSASRSWLEHVWSIFASKLGADVESAALWQLFNRKTPYFYLSMMACLACLMKQSKICF